MADKEVLEALVAESARRGWLPAVSWPANHFIQPETLGLNRMGERYVWATPPDVLDLTNINSTLFDLATTNQTFVDSTNLRMVEWGANSPISNHLCLAEFQYGGRGRRGRSWTSPFARNLAMSLGVGTQRPLSELGGLSLVVGLALADALESLGVKNIDLKWPNDILINAEKLCGILIELVQRGSTVEYVVGMGVNVQLTDEEIETIGQPVTDLRRHGVTQNRTELVCHLIPKVQTYLNHFEAEGFAPFVSAFNDLHVYHGKTCSLIQGANTITGEVLGVGEQGELIMQTSTGEQRFHGGEVSLRPTPD